jgi:uroporphyrinogen decarboxylase
VNLASGRVLAVLDDLIQTGAVGIVASVTEDLREMKVRCRGKLAVMGNLNGIEMRRWSPAETEAAVKEAIRKAGPGGGFILNDNHGEIPWQVPDDVLLALAEAARHWGDYPLKWVDIDGA